MTSPREAIRMRLPGQVDEFVYTLLGYIIQYDLHNHHRFVVEEYLLKVYHSLVYTLTLHRVRWGKVRSLRRPMRSPTGYRLLAVNRRFRDAFHGEFLHSKRPQPPAHYVVEMLESVYAENQREVHLLRFFGRLSSNNKFCPKILCKAKYNNARSFKAKGVNVACDPTLKSKYCQNLVEDNYHPAIRRLCQRALNGLLDAGDRTFWSNVRSRSVLIPDNERVSASPRPPCLSCYETFPGVSWNMAPGRQRYPIGNCAEVCAFSKIKYMATPDQDARQGRQRDRRLRQVYQRYLDRFERYLR